jgi:UDPglucose 6-dehydrogenase
MQRSGETVGVIGAGVVGGTLASWLDEQGHDVRIYDPPQGHDDATAMDGAETVFVCVPTPYTPGIGFDDRHLLHAVGGVQGAKAIVIKSTVLPGTTDLLQSRFPQHRFMFNPEFLREATAPEDFLNPDRQIVGRAERATMGDAQHVMGLLPLAPFERICDAADAEMAKYVANSFLAMKVSFANEVFDLCHRMRIDYAQVRDIAAADARIGPSHLDVLHGGYRGYGGKCLPKDSKSLLDLAKSVGVELRVLAAADEVNAILRPDSIHAPLLRVIGGETGDEQAEQAA